MVNYYLGKCATVRIIATRLFGETWMMTTPMFTMVKSQTLGEPPAALSEKSQGLLETLSMLCSFHTAEDLASFLYSPMFVELAQQGEVWLGFEIGLYVDHAKILDLNSFTKRSVVCR